VTLGTVTDVIERAWRPLAAALVVACMLAACSSSPAATAPSTPSASTSAVAPTTMLAIAAAEKACMNVGDALNKQASGAPVADIAAAMTAASSSARAAAEQDVRWSAFANDVGAIANGAATTDITTRVGGVCAQLSTDASVYTTTDPYPAG
jgi:hypothetical protein